MDQRMHMQQQTTIWTALFPLTGTNDVVSVSEMSKQDGVTYIAFRSVGVPDAKLVLQYFWT